MTKTFRILLACSLSGLGLGVLAAVCLPVARAYYENVTGAVCQPVSPSRESRSGGGIGARFLNYYPDAPTSSAVCPLANRTGLEPLSVTTIRISGNDASTVAGISGKVSLKVCGFYAASSSGGSCGAPTLTSDTGIGAYNLKVADITALDGGETPYLWVDLPKPDSSHATPYQSSVSRIYIGN